MEIKQLQLREDLRNNPKLKQIQAEFEKLIEDLNTKNLPEQTVELINQHTEELNASSLTVNALKKLLLKKRNQIIKLLEKKHKFVPKNYYRNMWMIVGMSAFGLPIGVTLGFGIGNLGFIPIGLPIGMTIGLALGISLDKKALNEGRQLNIDLKNTML